MSNSINNVVVAKPLVTGGVLVAPLGTTLPTDAGTALDAAFKAIGYVSDNGVTKSEKRNTGVLYAWGGDTIAVTQKGYDVTVKLDLAEFLNPEVQKLIYGDANVTVTPATISKGNLMTVSGSSQPTPRKVWTFEMKNDSITNRLVLPIAKVMDIGDTNYQDDKLAVYPVTLQAFPDANGKYFYNYSDDGQLLAS